MFPASFDVSLAFEIAILLASVVALVQDLPPCQWFHPLPPELLPWTKWKCWRDDLFTENSETSETHELDGWITKSGPKRSCFVWQTETICLLFVVNRQDRHCFSLNHICIWIPYKNAVFLHRCQKAIFFLIFLIVFPPFKFPSRVQMWRLLSPSASQALPMTAQLTLEHPQMLIQQLMSTGKSESSLRWAWWMVRNGDEWWFKEK